MAERAVLAHLEKLRDQDAVTVDAGGNWIAR